MTSSPAPAQPRVRVIALGDEMLAGAGDQRAMGWFTRALAQHNGSGDLVDSYTPAKQPRSSHGDGKPTSLACSTLTTRAKATTRSTAS